MTDHLYLLTTCLYWLHVEVGLSQHVDRKYKSSVNISIFIANNLFNEIVKKKWLIAILVYTPMHAYIFIIKLNYIFQNVILPSTVTEKMRRKIYWTDGRTEGRTDGQTDRGKTAYPPPPSGSRGIIIDKIDFS